MPATENASEGEKKPEQAQLELFAEKTDKIAEKLDATVQSVAALAAQVADRPAPQVTVAPQAQPQQRLTEEQVMALVEDKKISLAVGMSYLNRLAREDAKAEARRETQEQLRGVGQQAVQADVSNKIAAYKQVIPALNQRGSPEWNEVAQRFAQLVGEGYDQTLATELIALREVYGRDPSKHTEVRERTRESAREAEVPSSSSRGSQPSGRRSSKSGESDPDLPSEARDYIRRMINIRQYKGWDDPKALKYIERFKSRRVA